MVPRTRLRLLLLAAALSGGCNLIFGINGGEPGGSAGTSGAGGDAGGPPAPLVVTPMQATLLAQTSVELTATVGGMPAGVTWKIVDANGGSMPQPGVYTAPAAMGTFHVQATTTAMPARTATVTLDVVQMVAPVVISSTGELPTATGQGTQSHLAYAQGTKQWWLFRDDPAGTGSLATKYSSDGFATWQTGATATLPMGHSQDGRDLSVAYRQLGGHDVVHVSQGFGSGSNLGRYHLRAALGSDQITFGSLQIVNPGGAVSGGSTPDGTSTIILPNGLVIDTTGYQSTPTLDPPPGLVSNCGGGDVDVYTSDVKDDGASSFDTATFSPAVLWCVPGVVQARQLLQLGDVVVLLYVDGGSQPPGNVMMDYRVGSTGFWFPPEGGSTMTPPSVFDHNDTFDINDWTATVQNGAVHAVRRVGSKWEHRVMHDPMNTANTWVNGAGIPSMDTLTASGVFLAPYGPGLILIAVSSDSGSLLYTAFDGSSPTFGAWSTLTLTSGGVSYLSGFAPDAGPKPAIVWTQTAGMSYAIAGLPLP